MYCYIKDLSRDLYDVTVWESEEDSFDDPGVKAVKRETICCNLEKHDDIIDFICDKMGLTECDVIDFD